MTTTNETTNAPGLLARLSLSDEFAQAALFETNEARRKTLERASRIAKLAQSALEQVSAYLEDRSDVIDGDYGQPEANAEMSLLGEVDHALGALTGVTGQGVAK